MSEASDRPPIIRGRVGIALAVAFGLVVIAVATFGVIRIVSAASSVAKSLTEPGLPKLTEMRSLPRPEGAVETGSGWVDGSIDSEPQAWVQYRLPTSTASVCTSVVTAYLRAGLRILNTAGSDSDPASRCTSSTEFRQPPREFLSPEVCKSFNASDCFTISLIKQNSYRLDYPG